MLKKISLLILLVLVLVGGSIFTYHTYQDRLWCNQFMENYTQHPPTDITDYTQKDILFENRCGSGSAFVWIVSGLVVFYVVGGVWGKGKKRV